MSGTAKRKLFGPLALGVVLALAGAGCVGASPAGDEDVAEADHGLDSADGDGSWEDGDEDEAGAQDDGDEDAPGPGLTQRGFVLPGQTVNDPQPQPWRVLDTGDPETATDPAPMTSGHSGTPSNGNGGK